MNHAERYTEFLNCCRTKQIRRIYLADANMVYFPGDGDFGCIVLEFEDCMYLVTNPVQYEFDDDGAGELYVQRIEKLEDACNIIAGMEIYKVLAFENGGCTFVAELEDEYGYFWSMEWETEHYFLFLSAATDIPIIIVAACRDEWIRTGICPDGRPLRGTYSAPF